MKVYFIGICGTAMGNVAVLMQDSGHQVAGSDKGIYPPMSDVLRDADVEVFQGWDEEHMQTFQPDLVVVGNAVTRGNPEVEYLLRTRFARSISLPDLIGSELLEDRLRVVITGTHGKTTTTSLTAWLLKQFGVDPGWLIGGVPRSLSSGSELGNESSPFVLEGDEYDSAFFDKRSKFIHYRPDVLVINNIEFDHADIFRDLKDVKRTFNHLIRIVPDNGVILANGDDPIVQELLPVAWTRVLFVGSETKNDYVISSFEETKEGSQFVLQGPGGSSWQYITKLKGHYNSQNSAMALLAAAYSIDSEDVSGFLEKANLDSYTGVARRQDVLFESEHLEVIEDFAHHPTAIRLCIGSIRNCYPGSEIVAVFEPRSNTSATKVLQLEFTQALSYADRVLISPVHRADFYSNEVRIDTGEMAQVLNRGKVQATAFSDKNALFKNLAGLDRDQQRVVLLFTNGSFGEPLQNYLGLLHGKG